MITTKDLGMMRYEYMTHIAAFDRFKMPLTLLALKLIFCNLVTFFQLSINIEQTRTAREALQVLRPRFNLHP